MGAAGLIAGVEWEDRAASKVYNRRATLQSRLLDERKEKSMSYRCPRCGATMVRVSTVSIPSIISYQCYGCGYLSKPVRETELLEILPEHLRQAQFSELRKGEEHETNY